ncbi:MAG TPA: exosortase [Steroidobacteraceae bacterium]|nr:exosortase [Steroidobacteraceae bacterium]
MPSQDPRGLLALLAPLAILALTGLHWLELFGLWNSTSTLGHGWLLLGLVGWELWQRRTRLSRLRLGLDVGMLALLAAVIAVWAATIWLGLENLRLTMLPVLLVAALAVATGREGARVFAFPILLLLFATPVWFYVQPVLQQITIVVVGFLVRAVGITALIEGELITLPSGSLRIADSCSGVHQFVVAALIGTVYAWWHADEWRTRAKLVALACLIAVVTNWVRVFALVVVGYLSEMQHYLVQVDHYWFGWALFAVSITIFFVLARRIVERQRVNDEAAG